MNVWIVFLFCLALSIPSRVFASTVATITHESGNLSEYTTTVTGGGDLAVKNTAALAGTTYGMSVTVNDTAGIYAYKMLPSPVTTGTVRYRGYINLNSFTMPMNAALSILIVSDATGNVVSMATLNRNAAGYGIYGVAVENGGNHVNSQIYPLSSGTHYFEILTVRSSSGSAADGYTRLWVDGTLAYTTISINNYTQMADYQSIIVGAPTNIDPGTAGTFYLDEIVVNNDGSLIGPRGQATQQPTLSPTRTPTITQTATHTPTRTPTATTKPAKPGDIVGNDGLVNIYDYNEVVRLFGSPYTIFDYNTVVANFGT